MLAGAGLEVIQFKHNILLVITIITITVIIMNIIEITIMITIMVIIKRASSSSLNSA